MTELTFTVGERATLDLRDSAGEVTIKDWDGATLKVEAGAGSPYVLREGDTFRLKLPEGGTVSLPIGLPVEVTAPASIRLRVTRAGGETDVRAVPERDDAGAGPVRDFSEFAEVMSEQGRRVVEEVARAVRASGSGVSEEVARKLDHAADKIDETARRAAERIQRELERTVSVAERYEEHGRRAAHHAEERLRRMNERLQRRAAREAERGARRASHGRSWLAERLEEWAEAQSRRPSAPQQGATEAERLAVLQMLREGKISAEQAAHLLDALGGT